MSPIGVIALHSEFASVRISRDDSANGPRLVVEDVRTGRSIALDPLELEWIAWSSHAEVLRLIPEELRAGELSDPGATP